MTQVGRHVNNVKILLKHGEQSIVLYDYNYTTRMTITMAFHHVIPNLI
jgi:hypothetical protein